MARLKILFLSHRIPYPPNKGDKIRSWHLLNLCTRIGDVDLVSHADDPRDLRHCEHLRESCRSVYVEALHSMTGRLRATVALFSAQPLSVAWMTRARVKSRVEQMIASQDYDLIVAFSSQVVAYIPRDCTVPVMLDAVDVDSEKWADYSRTGGVRRWLSGLEAVRMRRFERNCGNRADRVILCTPREVALWREAVQSGSAVHIGNGVAFPNEVPPAAARESDLMVFSGAMDYAPNVEAAELGARVILPAVRAQRPQARLRIVGRNPTGSVRALAVLPGVEVTGEVVSIAPHLAAASLALVPLIIARGIQNKVLEALAHGLPVLTTPGVALSLQDGGAGGVLACTPEGMASAACALLGDSAERERMAQLGRRFVQRNHCWSQFDTAFEHIVGSLTRGAHAAPKSGMPCP